MIGPAGFIAVLRFRLIGQGSCFVAANAQYRCVSITINLMSFHCHNQMFQFLLSALSAVSKTYVIWAIILYPRPVSASVTKCVYKFDRR